MARPLRIEYPGAWYHVMNRGAGKAAIFGTPEDYYRFLGLLREAWQRFALETHAYCLMPNHYHLLVQTPEGQLGRALRHLNGVYTQYFNRVHDRDGPLFRGRYKAVLVEAESYWTWLSRYIHRNPLDAGLVTRLVDYPWSSYPVYAGHREGPDWLVTGEVLAEFPDPAAYRRFVEGTQSASPLEANYGPEHAPAVLGSEAFTGSALHRVPPHPDVPAERKLRPRPGVEEILAAVARHYGERPEDLYHVARGRAVRTPARAVAMYLCQEEGGMRLREIAERFNLAGYASAGATIRNVRQRLQRGEGALQADLNYILQDLTPG